MGWCTDPRKLSEGCPLVIRPGRQLGRPAEGQGAPTSTSVVPQFPYLQVCRWYLAGNRVKFSGEQVPSSGWIDTKGDNCLNAHGALPLTNTIRSQEGLGGACLAACVAREATSPGSHPSLATSYGPEPRPP